MLGKSLASIVRDLMLLSRGAKGVCKLVSVIYCGHCRSVVQDCGPVWCSVVQCGAVLPVDRRGVSGAGPAVTPPVPCCTLDYWVSTESCETADGDSQ